MSSAHWSHPSYVAYVVQIVSNNSSNTFVLKEAERGMSAVRMVGHALLDLWSAHGTLDVVRRILLDTAANLVYYLHL